MSEKNSWEKDFPETPESFRMALKEMVEKEIADDEIEVKVNDGTNHVKGKINKRNTKYMQDRRSSANVSNRRWRVVKIAVAALVGRHSWRRSLCCDKIRCIITGRSRSG